MMDLGSDIATLEDDLHDFNIEKDFRTSLKVDIYVCYLITFIKHSIFNFYLLRI